MLAKSYMLGHHIYSKNSFPAWQTSSHDIEKVVHKKITSLQANSDLFHSSKAKEVDLT